MRFLSNSFCRGQELQLKENSFVAPVLDAEAELVRLRAQVAELQGSPNVQKRHTKQRICPVEDMPGLIPAELSVWMEGCAGSFSLRNHSRVIELSSMLTKGAERMVEMTRLDISDDEFLSRAAPGEGRFGAHQDIHPGTV